MTDRGLSWKTEKCATFDDLKETLDSIKYDIQNVKNMKVAEGAKIPILEALNKQLDEVKEDMHNYIDSL